MAWAWPILGALIASTAALVGSGLILALGDRAERAAGWLLAFAIGGLLGAATLALLPEALERAEAERVLPLFLAGILGFTVFERVLRWRHPHAAGPHRNEGHGAESVTALMLLWGDALHNFVDGLVLGVTFSVEPQLGAAATLAVFAHEVPQEVGDFAILLESGMSRGRALALNYLCALTPVPGALLAFAGAREWSALIGWLLPVAAGGFVYIALADLVPALHHRRGRRAGAAQLALLGLGVFVIWAVG